MAGFRDVNYRRLPWSTRHLINSIRKRGTGWQMASSLRAHVNAIEYATRVDSKPNTQKPAEPGDAPGLHVRLGADTRDILRRLSASRNRLVQLALIKELRASIHRRIEIHKRRSARARAARERGRSAARMTGAWGSAARTGVLVRAERVRSRQRTEDVPELVPEPAPGSPPERTARNRRRGPRLLPGR
jgi:hypothetical protein